VKILVWKCREPKLETIWLRYSLQCHLAFDGDKLLVTNHSTLVNAAERNNKEKSIVPLFYTMSKAKAEILTPDSLYHGLVLAFTGGNIGEISNSITKIWNSGEITDEKLKVIKWLVMINNFVIDYAKTLYKPTIPNEISKIISKYTKSKVPAFFTYAKNKNKEETEPISNSCVDRIRKIYKKKNLKYNFKQDNIGIFDYKVLMNNPDVKFVQEVADYFKEVSSKLNFNRSDDKKCFNQYSVYEDAKSKILDLPYDKKKILDIIIIDLFKNRNTPRKKAFWTLFGNDVFENVEHNLNNNFVLCEKCHKRFYKTRIDQTCCSNCRGYKKIGVKSIICCDCGKEFEIDSKDTKSIRCNECLPIYIKERDRLRKQKYRQHK